MTTDGVFLASTGEAAEAMIAPTTWVIYHAPDHDGHLSGFLVKDALQRYEGDKVHVELTSMSYGYDRDAFTSKLNTLKPTRVFIVDFSLDEPDMQAVKDMVGKDNFIWLDHHKTAMEKLKKFETLPGNRDEEHAACRLVYDYMHTNFNYCPEQTTVPMAVQLVDHYDRWDHMTMPQSVIFTAGLNIFKTMPHNEDGFGLWSDLIHKEKLQGDWHEVSPIAKVMSAGEIVMTFRTQQGKYLSRHLGVTEFHGGTFAVLTGFIPDSYGLPLSVRENVDGLIWTYYIPKRGEWKVSIRGMNDYDVESIATRYQGGGHVSAASFYVKELPKEFMNAKSWADYKKERQEQGTYIDGNGNV